MDHRFNTEQGLKLKAPDEIQTATERDLAVEEAREIRRNLQVDINKTMIRVAGYDEAFSDGLRFPRPPEVTPHDFQGVSNPVISVLHPKALLGEHLYKGLQNYNIELCEVLDAYINALEELELRSKYTVRVHVLEWREYEVKVEADDLDDLERQLSSASDVNEFMHDGGEGGAYFQAIPSRLEGLKWNDLSTDGDIIKVEPCDG